MNWFRKLISRVRNIGLSKAIDGLDYVEPILAEKIESAKNQISKLDSKGLATWVVDELQDLLRAYFQLGGQK